MIVGRNTPVQTFTPVRLLLRRKREPGEDSRTPGGRQGEPAV
ncbi:MAG: hypothetical protein ACLQVJ_22290 [Syntrophobacteraceae bacterium]